MIHRLKEIKEAEAKAIKNIPIDLDIIDAIRLIVDQCHNKGGKLVCSGMGKAGQIALNISTTFSSTGTPSVYLHPSEAQHGDLGILQENDLLLLISNSGETREVKELIELAEDLYPQIKVIAITRNTSTLDHRSDVTIFTGETVEVCPLGLTPTTSTTVMTVIGDMLVCGVMESIGFTREEYAKRHHGGYLGKKSKETL